MFSFPLGLACHFPLFRPDRNSAPHQSLLRIIRNRRIGFNCGGDDFYVHKYGRTIKQDTLLLPFCVMTKVVSDEMRCERRHSDLVLMESVSVFAGAKPLARTR